MIKKLAKDDAMYEQTIPNGSIVSFGKTLRDSFFWFTGGRSWLDRFRLLYYWLSPRLWGYQDSPPKPVHTRFLEGRPIYIRSTSTDIRVLRHVFSNLAYALPEELTGQVSNVVDLGANVGISTLYFAERYRTAKVLAVEPDISSYTCLQRNVKTISAGSRVSADQACVSDKRGTVRFSKQGPSWGRSIVEEGGIEVPSFTIADLLDKHGIENVDILKMDIEGAEKLAFKSVNEWINRVGWIVVEVHFSAMSLADLVATVAPYGRRVFLKVESPSPHWVEVNADSDSQIKADIHSLDVVIPPALASIKIYEATKLARA